jgi:WD40 repeat protein
VSDRRAAARQSGWSQLFGYDVFLSFALGEPPRGTRGYSSDLARKLRERDLTVFYSEEEAAPGRELTRTLQSALKRSRLLVVVCNRDMLAEPRWVSQEVQHFRQFNPRRDVVPISIGAALNDPTCAAADKWLGFSKRIWLDEAEDAVFSGTASDAVVNGIGRSVSSVRSGVRLRAALAAIMMVLSGLSAYAWWQRAEAEASAQDAELQRDVAVQERGKAQEQAEKARAAASEAQVARLEAERQLRKASSRETAAESVLQFNLRVDHAFALAAQAAHKEPTHESLGSLLKAGWKLSPALRHALNGHNSAATALLFDPMGKLLFSGGEDSAVVVWDLEKRRIRRVLNVPIGTYGGRQGISALALRDDGLLAVGTDRDAVFVWNLNEQAKPKLWFKDGGAVQALHYVDGGNSLRSLGYRGSSLDEQYGAAPPLPARPSSAQASSVPFFFYARTEDASITVLVGTPTRRRVLKPAPRLERVIEGTASADGKRMALAHADGTISTWDLTQEAPTPDVLPSRTSANVVSMAMSADGKELALGLADGAVKLSMRDERGGHWFEQLDAHQGAVGALAFSPDGRTLASGGADGAVFLWDVDMAAGRTPWRPAAEGTAAATARGLLLRRAPQLLEDGRVVEFASGQPRGLRMDLAPLAALPGRVAVSHDDAHVALVAAAPLTIIVAPSGNPQAARRWKAPLALSQERLAVASGGRRLATFGKEGSLVLIDPARPQPVQVAKAPAPAEWNLLDFSGDGNRLAWLNEHGLTVLDPVDGTATSRAGPKKFEAPRALRMNQEGTGVAILVGDEIQYWRVPLQAEPELRLRLPRLSEVRAMQFSRDGQRLYVEQRSSSAPPGWTRQNFLLWDLNSAQFVKAQTPWSEDVEPVWQVTADDQWLIARQGSSLRGWPVGMQALSARACLLTRNWGPGMRGARTPPPMPPCTSQPPAVGVQRAPS